MALMLWAVGSTPRKRCSKVKLSIVFLCETRRGRVHLRTPSKCFCSGFYALCFSNKHFSSPVFQVVLGYHKNRVVVPSPLNAVAAKAAQSTSEKEHEDCGHKHYGERRRLAMVGTSTHEEVVRKAFGKHLCWCCVVGRKMREWIFRLPPPILSCVRDLNLVLIFSLICAAKI